MCLLATMTMSKNVVEGYLAYWLIVNALLAQRFRVNYASTFVNNGIPYVYCFFSIKQLSDFRIQKFEKHSSVFMPKEYLNKMN